MSTPYPYLWSLPSRTLDPDMALLRGILAGPKAPTWIVVRGSHTRGRLVAAAPGPCRARSPLVGSVCRRPVYLLRGLDRPTVEQDGSCGGMVLP